MQPYSLVAGVPGPKNNITLAFASRRAALSGNTSLVATFSRFSYNHKQLITLHSLTFLSLIMTIGKTSVLQTENKHVMFLSCTCQLLTGMGSMQFMLS